MSEVKKSPAERQKEYCRRYRIKHAEQYKKNAREYAAKHVEHYRSWREQNADLIKQKRAANAEKTREKAKKYRAANAEYLSEKARRYRAENATAQNAKNKEYRAANPEREKERKRKYYAANRERMDAKHKAYREANPGAQRAWASARRSREQAAEGTHTAADIKALWLRQGKKCAVKACTSPISDVCRHPAMYHVDHIIPITPVSGPAGTNWPDNLQILCATHNTRKRNKDPYEWAKEVGRLFA